MQGRLYDEGLTIGRFVNSAENIDVSNLSFTSGMYGTGSSFRYSLSQSIDWKNGWLFTAAASLLSPPRRCFGSFCNNYRLRARAAPTFCRTSAVSGLRFGGISTLERLILLNRRSWSRL